MSTRTKHLGTGPAGQPRASTDREALAKRATANSAVEGNRARHSRYQTRRPVMRWNTYLLLLGAVAVILLIGSGIVRELGIPKGNLATAQTSHDFGNVPIQGGDITTRFALTVQGDARAVDITST